MQLTVDVDALTVQDLQVLDAFLDGATVATQEQLIGLLEQIAIPSRSEAEWTDGQAMIGGMNTTQLARVAQRIRREIADRADGHLPKPSRGWLSISGRAPASRPRS